MAKINRLLEQQMDLAEWEGKFGSLPKSLANALGDKGEGTEEESEESSLEESSEEPIVDQTDEKSATIKSDQPKKRA